MAQLISLSIDVTKIDKTKLFKGKKGTYLNITVAVNDKPDDYGNDVSCWEKTENKDDPKNYLGNGKVFWKSDSGQTPNEEKRETNNDTDDLPF